MREGVRLPYYPRQEAGEMKESVIQKSIIDYLKLKGYLVVKFPSVGIYKKATDSYIPQPMRGVSDILFWGGGRFGSIEVKAKKNKPTQAQLEFGVRMRSAGGMFMVAYSIDDVMEVL